MLCIVLLASAAGDEKRITIYSPIADYSLNVSDRDGREYVGLLEILEPLGSVTAKIDKDNWKLRFNSIEAQFTKGQNRARIRGRDFDLPARFLIDNGRGLVPIDGLVTLLPQFLGIPVVFHVNSRRLFISEAGTTYTAELSKSTPGKLVLNFSRPVNPNIATEPGKLRMSFVRDPLLASGPQTVNFNDKSITSAFFQESNGSAELTVAGNHSFAGSYGEQCCYGAHNIVDSAGNGGFANADSCAESRSAVAAATLPCDRGCKPWRERTWGCTVGQSGGKRCHTRLCQKDSAGARSAGDSCARAARRRCNAGSG
jgi:hypothetical protein